MIKIKNIFKSFDKKVIFNGFSAEFSTPGIYALTGESGIGKTTLLRIIAGLDKRYKGDVIFSQKVKISVAFQEHRLFPEITAFDNVLLASFDKPTDENKKLVKEMFLRLGFSDEDMYLTPRELSGGMKQRASLARAFLADCNLLLLDEPTKELDEKIATTVREIISELARTKTVIFISHNTEDIKLLKAHVVPIVKEN